MSTKFTVLILLVCIFLCACNPVDDSPLTDPDTTNPTPIESTTADTASIPSFTIAPETTENIFNTFPFDEVITLPDDVLDDNTEPVAPSTTQATEPTTSGSDGSIVLPDDEINNTEPETDPPSGTTSPNSDIVLPEDEFPAG